MYKEGFIQTFVYLLIDVATVILVEQRKCLPDTENKIHFFVQNLLRIKKTSLYNIVKHLCLRSLNENSPQFLCFFVKTGLV
jgi:hypothetical protein